MTILYINPLHTDITISLLNWSTLEKSFIIPKGDDFVQFPDTIMEIIKNHAIKEIWLILWPGAFTRMRIVTLTLSSLILSKWIIVKWCHFFELIQGSTPILQANNEEYLTQDTGWNIHLIKWKDLLPWRYEGYGNQNDFADTKVLVEYKENWSAVHWLFGSLSPLKTLAPFYLKEPHITCSTKNKSHS